MCTVIYLPRKTVRRRDNSGQRSADAIRVCIRIKEISRDSSLLTKHTSVQHVHARARARHRVFTMNRTKLLHTARNRISRAGKNQFQKKRGPPEDRSRIGLSRLLLSTLVFLSPSPLPSTPITGDRGRFMVRGRCVTFVFVQGQGENRAWHVLLPGFPSFSETPRGKPNEASTPDRLLRLRITFFSFFPFPASREGGEREGSVVGFGRSTVLRYPRTWTLDD